jgi:hypothetical protein
VADNLLTEVLFNNADMGALEDNLDKKTDKGGANWDKRRVKHFVKRLKEIIYQADSVKKSPEQAPEVMADYLVKLFDINIDDIMKKRLASFLKLRIENKVDFATLQEKLDSPGTIGGLGLYRGTAEKMVREVEIIMLLEYTA